MNQRSEPEPLHQHHHEKMQIETSVKYHYMHIRMTKMRENIGTTIAGRDSEKKTLISGESANWYTYFRRQILQN